MLQSNAPGKLLLPWANAGGKSGIPVGSQIGITDGAASLTDGFPPVTRTPISAGGTPPSGLDMNGILYSLSAACRWSAAGGGYAYDAAFAADGNVGGYPKGARVLRSDGLGYWLNTADSQTVDPESSGAAAAGWVPDVTAGSTTVAMSGSNVTLTPLQYGKRVIVVTGALSADVNLIFPAIVAEWSVVNRTTGGHTVTAKTASGTGVALAGAQAIVGDGTDIVGILVASSLKAANGWRITPDGFLEQWGVLSGVGLNQTFYTITFPRVFSVAYNVTPTISMDAVVSGSIGTIVRNITTTTFQVAGDNSTDAGTGAIYWRALGLP